MGAYFRCIVCGNVSYYKGLQLNPHIKNMVHVKAGVSDDSGSRFGSFKKSGQSRFGNSSGSNSGMYGSTKKTEKKKYNLKKEITVTSDELDFMY